jgi:hypothetical protein
MASKSNCGASGRSRNEAAVSIRWSNSGAAEFLSLLDSRAEVVVTTHE